jgi:hypothetical protein
VVLAAAELVEFRLLLRVRVCHRQGRRGASILEQGYYYLASQLLEKTELFT